MAESPSFNGILGELIEPTPLDIKSDEKLDAWMKRRAQAGHHISGTCKMGPEGDPMAVVDQYGRVHGMDGLRVADASIMPDCIRANTNQTALSCTRDQRAEKPAQTDTRGRLCPPPGNCVAAYRTGEN